MSVASGNYAEDHVYDFRIHTQYEQLALAAVHTREMQRRQLEKLVKLAT